MQRGRDSFTEAPLNTPVGLLPQPTGPFTPFPVWGRGMFVRPLSPSAALRLPEVSAGTRVQQTSCRTQWAGTVLYQRTIWGQSTEVSVEAGVNTHGFLRSGVGSFIVSTGISARWNGAWALLPMRLVPFWVLGRKRNLVSKSCITYSCLALPGTTNPALGCQMVR